MKTRPAILIATIVAAVTTGLADADQVLRMPRPPAMAAPDGAHDYPIEDVGAVALARYAGARERPTPGHYGYGYGWGSYYGPYARGYFYNFPHFYDPWYPYLRFGHGGYFGVIY